MKFDLTVLIATCDKYNFLWNPFSELFNLYWDKNIEVKKCFVGETIKGDISDFTFLTPGKFPNNAWSDRIKCALDQIETKYVLLLLDDYFLVKTNPIENFETYFYLLEHYQADKLSIHYPHEELKLTPLIKEFDIYQMDQDSPYTTTTQSSIWNVEFFKSCLEDNQSIWQFEIEGSKKLNDRGHKILFHQIIDRWYFEAMTKGKFNPEYYHILNHHNLSNLIHTI